MSALTPSGSEVLTSHSPKSFLSIIKPSALSQVSALLNMNYTHTLRALMPLEVGQGRHDKGIKEIEEELKEQMDAYNECQRLLWSL